MCEVLETEDVRWADFPYGLLIDLCDAAAEHLPVLLDDNELSVAPVEARDNKRLTQTISMAGKAGFAVLELDYFDLDHRSETALIAGHQYRPDEMVTDRLHFFGGALENPRESLPLIVDQARDSYLGYIVIRPTGLASQGRTLLSPSDGQKVLLDGDGVVAMTQESSVSEVELHTTKFADHVRTVVHEQVNLFGVELIARGVPFMQQNSVSLVCAHVAAWMAHYTLVLRGEAFRRATASFHTHSDHGFGRSSGLPTDGLAPFEVGKTLSSFGLAVRQVGSTAGKPPTPTPFDRREVWDVATNKKLTDQARAEFWRYEHLTAAVCRYLNSGMPVVIHKQLHSTVICGFFRETDLVGAKSTDPDSGLSHFITHDDNLGPYLLEPAKKLFSDFDKGSAFMQVAVPEGVWMAGTSAENAVAQILENSAAAALAFISDASNFKDAGDRALAPTVEDGLGKFVAALKKARDELVYSLRTYFCGATDFKHGFRERYGKRGTPALDERAVEVITMLRLPKYVWVVEIVDRKARRERRPDVVGEVVLDATEVWPDARIGTPMLVHMPGVIELYKSHGNDNKSIIPLDDGGQRTYETGRWDHAADWLTGPAAMAARTKGNLAG